MPLELFPAIPSLQNQAVHLIQTARVVGYVQREVVVWPDHPYPVAFPFLQERDALFVIHSSPGSTPSASANLSTVTCCAFLVPSSNPTIVLRGTPLAFESSSTVRERSPLILSRLPSFLGIVHLRFVNVFRDQPD